jgi:polar amino acid transport system substrate-binding protein
MASLLRIKGFLYPFFLVTCLVSSIPLCIAAQERLVLNTPGEPPYHHQDQTGIADLLIKEAFSRIGREATVQWQPPERSLMNANMGIVDGDVGRIGGLNKEYPHLIQVPETFVTTDFLIFTKTFSIRLVAWESLKPYHVAIIRGHKIAEANVVARSLIKARNAEILFLLLNNDRVDVAICERLFGSMMARKTNPEIKGLEPPLATADFYLYLHKKHEALVPEIAKALETMKRDGTYKRLWLQGQRKSFLR